MNGWVWLARHGETTWNREGRMQGRLGSPFTVHGRTQIERLAAAAASWDVTLVMASPLERARETARRVAERCGRPLVVCDALAEIDFGECSGLTMPEIEARFPGLLEARRADRWGHRWPAGESYEDVERRVAAECAVLAAPRTLIVAHQSVNRVLASLLARMPRREALSIVQPADVVLRLASPRSIGHARLGGVGEVRWYEGLPARVERAA